MPIPHEHLEQLKTQLGEHESRLETLRLQILSSAGRGSGPRNDAQARAQPRTPPRLE